MMSSIDSSEPTTTNLPLQFDGVRDTLKTMRRQEATVYRLDFRPTDLQALWRKILIEWMTFVVEHCKLQKQVVAAAAYFLDFAMADDLLSTKEEHQLAAASALQLSLKLFDSTVIRIEKLVSLGRGLFTKEDVAEMEFRLVKAMDFHCHPPSTYCFLRQYDLLLPTKVSDVTRRMIDEVTRVVVDLTIIDPEYSTFPPSVIAYGAILMAMEMLSVNEFPIPQRQCFILRMATVSELNSSSPLILKGCDKLKETLNSSTRLEDLLNSLRRQRQQQQGTTKRSNGGGVPKSPTTTTFCPKLIQSPRDVMMMTSTTTTPISETGSISRNSSFRSLGTAAVLSL